MRALVGLVVAALVAASVVLFVWVPFADPTPEHADAIVVLAGSKTRLPLGLGLWRDGVAPTLAVSRDPHERSRRAFCARPPAHAFCFSAHPYSTRGEARAVARLARARRWDSVAVVSSRFHLFRARLLLERCTNVRLELVPAHVTWWRWAIAIPSEWGKLAVALTARRSC